MSSDELEQERVATMGSDLGRRYHALWNELVWLNMKWREFETLFAHSGQRLELLNEVAPHYFWQQQITLWEDMLLGLARITDPPLSVKKTNLSIQALDKVVPDPVLAQEVRDLAAAAVSSCGFARDWRNRRLAHNDLDLMLNQAAVPLAAGNRKDVQDALEAIGRVLSRIHSFYEPNSEVVWAPLGVYGGADALVAYLERAVQAKDQQREEWRRKLAGE
jgi:hypothetical protein